MVVCLFYSQFARFKAVPHEASGTRQCNCRTEMKTVQVGPGRFQVRNSRQLNCVHSTSFVQNIHKCLYKQYSYYYSCFVYVVIDCYIVIICCLGDT